MMMSSASSGRKMIKGGGHGDKKEKEDEDVHRDREGGHYAPIGRRGNLQIKQLFIVWARFDYLGQLRHDSPKWHLD
jgi:hypothetical protein